MRIEVTKDDIAQGIPDRAYYCPVALALRRATNQDWHVGPGALMPCVGESYVDDEVPKSVRRFVKRFDSRKDVKPFAFELPEERIED